MEWSHGKTNSCDIKLEGWGVSVVYYCLLYLPSQSRSGGVMPWCLSVGVWLFFFGLECSEWFSVLSWFHLCGDPSSFVQLLWLSEFLSLCFVSQELWFQGCCGGAVFLTVFFVIVCIGVTRSKMAAASQKSWLLLFVVCCSGCCCLLYTSPSPRD